MYVALSKGFVADEGLEVEMITANGGDRAGALLLSGQTEFALAGPEVLGTATLPDTFMTTAFQ